MQRTAKRIGFRVGGVVAAGLVSACCTTTETCEAPDSASLTVPLIGQEEDLWCWAACAEMCLDYLGIDVSQCDVANASLEFPSLATPPDCCVEKETCDQAAWPQFDPLGAESVEDVSGTSMTWSKIREQIFCKKSPIAFVHEYDDASLAHMMVAYGYYKAAGDKFVMVHDPLPTGGTGTDYDFTYEAFVGGGSYVYFHSKDYYAFKKK